LIGIATGFALAMIGNTASYLTNPLSFNPGYTRANPLKLRGFTYPLSGEIPYFTYLGNVL
jgi:hypothetical protein